MKKTNKGGHLGILAFLLVGFVVACSTLWMNHSSDALTAKTADQISSLYLRELSSATGKHLQTVLAYHFAQVDAAGQMLDEETAAKDGKLREYITLTKDVQGFSFLAFLDEEGFYHDGLGAYSAASNVSFLGKLLKGETHLISYNEKIQDNDVILIGSRMEPVKVGDTRLIAVLAGISTEDMSRRMVLANDQSHTYSSVVTTDGTYVILSDMMGQLKGSNMLSALKKSSGLSGQGDALESVTKGLHTGSHGICPIQSKAGEDFYLYYAPLVDTEWFLVTVMPYEVIEETIRELGASINFNSWVVFCIFLAALLVLFSVYILLNQKKQNLLDQAKRSAEQALQSAEEANNAKSAFLSNMSHDIRTPMNAIVGFATLLQRDAESPEKVRDYGEKIANSSRHLLSLINDVLDMAKIESGKTALNISKTSLGELIEDINTIIRPQMKAKGHQFDIRMNYVRHEMLQVDKLRIHQILLNLLSNAVKYTPDGGHITLEVTELGQLSEQNARFSFRVSDNGYGMEPEYLKSVFDTFSREQDSVISKIQGTGLGLAITKNLVDLMNGKISVESEKGKGSVFTVELELMVAEESDGGTFWRDNQLTHMLVVDDEEHVCRNVSWAMGKLGVEVDAALDGQSAVELAREAKEKGDLYKIVLLDWKMPGKNGIDTARELRELLPPGVAIMVLTSYDYAEIEEELAGEVVDGFIPKPFFESSFRLKVQEIVGKAKEAAPKEKPGGLKGLHILVAEDNELNAEILTDLLEMKGATCHVCVNGKSVWETFENSRKGEYQLILMDVQMPIMNGYEATRKIRACSHPQAASVPIIAMTANAFADDVQNALDAGMDAHLAKPVDIQKLDDTIRAILKKP